MYGDAEAMRYVGDGEPITKAQCEEWIQVTHRNYAQRGYGMFALVEAENGAIIGFAGLVHPGGQVEPEVKYALLKSHWGRGFATEAVRGMLAYASERQLARVIATVHPDNHASQHVLEKCGMGLAERRVNEDDSITLVYTQRSANITA